MSSGTMNRKIRGTMTRGALMLRRDHGIDLDDAEDIVAKATLKVLDHYYRGGLQCGNVDEFCRLLFITIGRTFIDRVRHDQVEAKAKYRMGVVSEYDAWEHDQRERAIDKADECKLGGLPRKLSHLAAVDPNAAALVKRLLQHAPVICRGKQQVSNVKIARLTGLSLREVQKLLCEIRSISRG